MARFSNEITRYCILLYDHLSYKVSREYALNLCWIVAFIEQNCQCTSSTRYAAASLKGMGLVSVMPDALTQGLMNVTVFVKATVRVITSPTSIDQSASFVLLTIKMEMMCILCSFVLQVRLCITCIRLLLVDGPSFPANESIPSVELWGTCLK